MIRFAHRGLVQYAPENTYEAFEAAINYGCEGIELDIHRSLDGEIIVAHDGDCSRMSDGKVNARINDMMTEEILKMDLPYAGHLLPYAPPVPYSEGEGSVRTYTAEELECFRRTDKRVTHLITFEEFDRRFSKIDKDVTIEIEVKDTGIMKRMRDILEKSTNVRKYILFSGENDINKEIQAEFGFERKMPELRLGANIRYINENTLDFIKLADLYEVGLNDFKCTADDIKMLNDIGIQAFSNLGDYPEWWSKLEDYGFAGFKTNYAEAYTDWKNNRNQ